MGDKKKYDVYRALIEDNILSKDNMVENSNNSGHYIMRNDGNRSFMTRLLLGSDHGVLIAQIVSEPTFAKEFVIPYWKCKGLKIALVNPYHDKIFKEFIKKFKDTFPDEKAELV